MSPGKAQSVCPPIEPRHERIGKHAQVRFLMPRRSLWVVCCVLLLGNLDKGSMARTKRRQNCSFSNIENSPVHNVLSSGRKSAKSPLCKMCRSRRQGGSARYRFFYRRCRYVQSQFSNRTYCAAKIQRRIFFARCLPASGGEQPGTEGFIKAATLQFGLLFPANFFTNMCSMLMLPSKDSIQTYVRATVNQILGLSIRSPPKLPIYTPETVHNLLLHRCA